MGRVVALWLAASLAAAASAQVGPALPLDALRARAEAGDRSATRALAEAFYLGREGLEQDFRQAALWYRKLAAQGDAAAQTSLGLMYARGLGFGRDMAEARCWWSLAAAQDDPGAQHNLGLIYLEGSGVAVDPAHALHWFERAARRGHVLAQRIAGLMYYEGKGTPRDERRGLDWLKRAADAGEEGAQETLRVIAERGDAQGFEQAERVSRQREKGRGKGER